MRLKAVVLPAPFGPIKASVSFSRTEKLTSCTACSPPNRLFRFLMTSASAIDLCLRRQGERFRTAARVYFGQIAHDAGRPPQDHSHQNEGVDGELNAANRIAEPALQQCRRRLQQDGADDWPPQRSDTANDRDQRSLDRYVEVERRLRIDEIDVLRIERAGQRREERADHEDFAFNARRVDADGHAVITDARALDPGRYQQRNRE